MEERRYPSLMLANAVRDFLHAVPFAPFVIRMNDGRGFPIPLPDFASVSPKGSTVTVYGDADGAMLLSSLLIASVEPLPGRAKRRKKTAQ